MEHSDPEELGDGEEVGILLAMDRIEAGQGAPLEEGMRQIRSRGGDKRDHNESQ